MSPPDTLPGGTKEDVFGCLDRELLTCGRKTFNRLVVRAADSELDHGQVRLGIFIVGSVHQLCITGNIIGATGEFYYLV